MAFSGSRFSVRLGILVSGALSMVLTTARAVQANSYPARMGSIYLEGCRRGATQTYRAQRQNPDLPRIESYCQCTFEQIQQTVTAPELGQLIRLPPSPVGASSGLTALKQRAVSVCALSPR